MAALPEKRDQSRESALGRLWQTVGATISRGWRKLKTAVSDLSLPAASSLTIIGLIAAAALALWLTGRPEGGEWWDFHPKPLEWKDRLTSGFHGWGVLGTVKVLLAWENRAV